MLRKLRLPSPAMTVALIALFVALGGTAAAVVEIVPLAKRALVADTVSDNAIVVKTKRVVLAPGEDRGYEYVSCAKGQRAIAGGYRYGDNEEGDNADHMEEWGSHPLDQDTWGVYLWMDRGGGVVSEPALIYVVCLK